MPEEQSQTKSMRPYIIIASILFVLLVVVVFWPVQEDESIVVEIPVAEEIVQEKTTTIAEPAPPIETVTTDEVEDFQPLPDLQEVVIGEDTSTPANTEALDIIEVESAIPEPLDISDSAVKSALQQVISSPSLLRYLVSDSLLQNFVINVNDLANGDSSPRNELVNPPAQSFRVYQQAGSFYIEPGSFQRYTPYVDILEAIDIEQMVKLLDEYRPEINSRFEEISRPGQSFDNALLDAIDTLLDTPQVPVPYEVYSESVMYKFKDDRLEKLPDPQKQLLRTGPENMRRIKTVLREIKQEL